MEGTGIKIIFLKLDSPEMAIARVQHRVRMGGHTIPEPVIRRRYARGWENFQNRYKALADCWQVYNAMKTPPVLMDEGGEEQ
jgi:predicted ABC-type ATPase